MSHLFAPFTMRGLTLPNRIVVSPMAQYSSRDGYPNEWHFVHLGSRAVGGPGLIMVESSAVAPQGRCTNLDSGMYLDGHADAFRPIVDFIHSQGVYAGIQLGHGGRKASMGPPWEGERILLPENGGWADVVAPSAIPYCDHFPVPVALTRSDIADLLESYASAARRSVAAGFDVIDIHAAHGYLLHEFLSPLSNHRKDEYGGVFENRIRFVIQVVDSVRGEMPGSMPLWVRISATDWCAGGWEVEDSIMLCKVLKERGVDLIDVSSGGMVPQQTIPVGAGYQTRLAQQVREGAAIPTGAVGLITSATQADHIIRTEQADLVLLAREILRNPYWPLAAARELGQAVRWPIQYMRAKPTGDSPERLSLPRQPVQLKCE